MMKIEKLPRWCEELERGLSLTFGADREGLIEGVNGGWLEAYRLWDGEAYMVTRTQKGVVTICCYQGKRGVEAMRWIRARVAQLGLKEILIFTRHKGMPRLLKEFAPVQEETIYRIRVA